MEPASLAKNAWRVASSQTLALVARLGGSARRRADALLQRANVPTRADVRRLSARLAALHAATDSLR